MTRITYCGNLLWQSSLTLLARNLRNSPGCRLFTAGSPSVLFDVKTIEGCAMMAKPLLWNIGAGGMSPVFMVDNAEARDALVAHVRRDFLYKHPAFA